MIYNLGTISPPPVVPADINIPIETFLNFFVGSGSVLFLIVFMYAAIQWLTSGGDKGRLEQAKNTITFAVIGMIILASTFATFQIIRAIFLDGAIVVTSGSPGTPPAPPPPPPTTPIPIPTGGAPIPTPGTWPSAAPVL